MTLADQVETLTALVRALLALAAAQLCVTTWLTWRVSRLRTSVRALVRRTRELEGTVDELDRHVRDVLEPELVDASEDAGQALALSRVSVEASEEEADSVRDFLRRTERPRATGGGE